MVIKKYTGLLLVVAILLQSICFTVLLPVPDSARAATTTQKTVLLDFGSESGIPDALAAANNRYSSSVSTSIKYPGKQTSLKWVMIAPASGGIDLRIPITASVADYANNENATITLRYYSEAVGSKFNFTYYPNDANWTGNYYPLIPTTTIEKTGWQTLTYKLSDVLTKVKYSSFGALSVSINDDGWGNYTRGGYNVGDTIYFDSVWVEVPVKDHNVKFSEKTVSNLASTTNVTYSTSVAYGSTSGSLKLNVPSNGTQISSRQVDFTAADVSNDWTNVGTISIPIYNAKLTGDPLNVIFSKTASGSDNGYYYYKINLNWTGWKVVNIRKTSFTAVRGITSWSEIGSLYFNIGGWSSQTPVAGTTIYISDVEGVNYTDLAAGNSQESSVIYAGSSKAQRYGSHITLSKAPEFKDGVIYAPTTMFSELIDMSSDAESVGTSDYTAVFEADSTNAMIGEYTHKLSYAPYEKDGVLYVSLSDVCNIFDIPLHIDGRFAMFGSEGNITAFLAYSSDGLNVLVEAASEELSSSDGGDVSAPDCNAVIANWVMSLAGSEELNDTTDSSVDEQVSSIKSEAEAARSKLIKTPGSEELFSNIKTTATLHMTTTAHNIYQMAHAYATYGTGSDYYLNESLLSDIIYCLDWFYENRYGNDEAEKNSNAWRDRSLFNWWDWGIGTPEYLIQALMLIEDKNPDAISDADIKRYLLCFDTIASNPSSTGANYLEICKLIIGSALLKGDGQKVRETINQVLNCFEYVDDGRWSESYLYGNRALTTPEKGQGFHKDGSYVFHTLHPMNGVYGLAHMTAASELISVLHGTDFELPQSCADMVAEWMLNGFDALMYSARLPRMVLGRENAPNEVTVSYDLVNAIMRSFKCFDEENQKKLGSVVRAVVGDSAYHSYSLADSYGKFVELSDVSKLREIADDPYYDDYSYTNSNVFYNMDKVMHKRQDWAVGLSMSSSRIFNYECINNQNPKGWYLGDGATEVFLKSEGNTNQSTYWKNVDYYRIPGTTVDTQVRQEVTVAQGNEYLSSKDFVGGVEMDNTYSTAAMHLESYHNDEDFGADNGEYGGQNPAHQNDLTAKKSYFMFDDEVFCLGAEINASNNNDAEVLTIVENKLTSSSSVNSDCGSVSPDENGTKLTDVKWLNLDDKMGYYFPVGYSDSSHYASISDGFFECWFTHGTNPTEKTYAYALLPGMTLAQTQAYADSPKVEILANNGSVQAVRNKEAAITSIVFWEAGSFGGVSVTEPMIVMIKEDGSKTKIAVSDPTQKLESASLVLEGKNMALINGSERITAKADSTSGNTTLNIDFESSRGVSLEACLDGGKVSAKSVIFRKESISGNEVNHYSAHKLSGTRIYAEVSLANLSGASNSDTTVYYAMYDAKNTLQAIKSIPAGELLPGEFKTLSSLYLTPDENTAMLKVFVWKSGTVVPCKSLYTNY